ncbi:unnamed protein product [Xylocopa violacea]|uniref:Uncharacterized protein n=1 Tax=Xylocopa violacea TaxID=135666 RepID=A0ABP1PF89_XYLVO
MQQRSARSSTISTLASTGIEKSKGGELGRIKDANELPEEPLENSNIGQTQRKELMSGQSGPSVMTLLGAPGPCDE